MTRTDGVARNGIGRTWLLTTMSSEERIYQGHEGYADDTRKKYQYDSFVPNHQRVSPGDIALIRGKNVVHGMASIIEVTSGSGEKLRRMCPGCGSSKLKERKVKRPRFRCECGSEFQTPMERLDPCTIYVASFGETFRTLKEDIPLQNLWLLAPRLNKQHAMLELDTEQVFALISVASSEIREFPGLSEIWSRVFIEGKLEVVLVNRLERSTAARKACIDHYGASCLGCGLSMEELYGQAGKGVIDVHHLDPIAGRSGPGKVDPAKDLRPLCPNCHRIVHTRNPPLAMDELRDLVRCHRPGFEV